MNKPNIFKPHVGNINNNRKVYYSFLEEDFNDNSDNYRESVNDPLKFISKLNESGYMVSKKVIIETKDKKYDTKIAGKVGNKIITMDNESILIDDIVNIYEK